jgi:uncharacterized membrane protein
MARIEKSLEINAPVEEVWKMLLPNRIQEWMKGIKVEYTSDEKEVIGATAHVVGEAAGIKAEWDIEITEYKKNEEARWRSTGGDVTAIGLTTLQSTETGAIGAFVLDYELPYSILGKMVDKILVSRELDRGIENGLVKLKNMLEK